MDAAYDQEIPSASRVILDGDLSEAKLVALIRRKGEEAGLDYKRSYDLNGSVTKDRLECVRDIVAMANTNGGYIVLGIDENSVEGEERFVAVGIPPHHLNKIDADKLQAQIERYISSSIKFYMSIHRLDLELTRFRGHSIIGQELLNRRCPDATDQPGLSTGVQSRSRATGPEW